MRALTHVHAGLNVVGGLKKGNGVGFQIVVLLFEPLVSGSYQLSSLQSGRHNCGPSPLNYPSMIHPILGGNCGGLIWKSLNQLISDVVLGALLSHHLLQMAYQVLHVVQQVYEIILSCRILAQLESVQKVLNNLGDQICGKLTGHPMIGIPTVSL